METRLNSINALENGKTGGILSEAAFTENTSQLLPDFTPFSLVHHGARYKTFSEYSISQL
jgi:hypothetical protein